MEKLYGFKDGKYTVISKPDKTEIYRQNIFEISNENKKIYNHSFIEMSSYDNNKKTNFLEKEKLVLGKADILLKKFRKVGLTFIIDSERRFIYSGLSPIYAFLYFMEENDIEINGLKGFIFPLDNKDVLISNNKIYSLKDLKVEYLEKQNKYNYKSLKYRYLWDYLGKEN